MKRKDEGQQKTSETLKITGQARVKTGGMTYGLKCQGVHLTLVVSPRTNEDDNDEWCVEASSSKGLAGNAVMSAWGPTRIEALRAVGRSWTESVDVHGLSMFDWEAVAKVLQEVRAL